jgi:hypothetical protein
MTIRTMPHNDPAGAIGVSADGKSLDYPSSKHSGVNIVAYPRRLPSIAHQPARFQAHQLKLRDLPSALVRDLTIAHREGNLREELDRHLTYLEKNAMVDKGTLKMLRAAGEDLTGHRGADEDTLDGITEIFKTMQCSQRPE